MRRFVLATAFLASGLACQSKDSTELVATVWSDLATPSEMDGVRLDVHSASDNRTVKVPVSVVSAGGTRQVVARLALVPLANKSETITIKATATLGTGDVVSQSARLSFVPGQAHELSLFLDRICINHDTCGTDFTCSNGSCSQQIDVVSATLPLYVPGKTAPLPDAGATDGAVVAVDSAVLDGRAIDGPVTEADGAKDVSKDVSLESPISPEVTGPIDGESLDGAADRPTTTVDAAGVDVGRDLVPDGAADRPADAPDAQCAAACTLTATQCGTGGGLRTCIAGSNGCPTWGPEVACSGRRTCSAGSGTCVCPAAPAGCSSGQGSFCATDGTLQSCVQDGDGCVVLTAPTICPAQKPCTGSYPSASCSCPTAPAICQNTVGTFCDTTNNTVVTCSRDAQGCLVSTVTKTCTSTKACGGTAGSADCTCPPITACDGVLASTSYCSGNDVVTCTANSEGCQSAATTTCPTGKPCKTSATGPACTCPAPPAACLNTSGTFVAGASCDSNGQLVKCGIDSVSGCPVAVSTTPCSSPTTCQGAQGSATCACPSVPECAGANQANGSYCSGSSAVITCVDKGGCQESSTQQCSGSTPVCAGAFPSAACVGEQTIGNYKDFGFPLGGGSLSTGYMYGWPVTVTAQATLLRFGTIYKGPLSGTINSTATFALYTSTGTDTASAQPNKLVGAAVQKQLSTSNGGRNEFAVTSPPSAVTLTPGVYWLMVTVDRSTQFDQNTGSTAPFRYFSQVWGDPLPSPATAITIANGVRDQNFYIVVMPQ